MRLFALTLAVAALPSVGLAFERITEPAAFASQVTGRALTRMGISLTVAQDGTITGRGMGAPVSGEWQWSDGYFCRTLDWGGRDLGHNCQAVLLGDGRVRFVSDRGAGDYADFHLR